MCLDRTVHVQERGPATGSRARSRPRDPTRVRGTPTWLLPTVRTFVLDTSVLLADPLALLRFDEHEVVLPVVVITELEGKRAHPELGYFARQALRLLDDLGSTHGRLDEPVQVGEMRRHRARRAEPHRPLGAAGRLPPERPHGDNDTTILAVARNLAAEGAAVTLVSKDLPMRVKASAGRPQCRGVPR